MIQPVAGYNVADEVRSSIQNDVLEMKSEFENFFNSPPPVVTANPTPDLASHTNVLNLDSSNAQSPYSSYIEEASKKYNIPEALINKIIQAESDFNPNSVSSSGAMGLMQLMPDTAKSLGVKNPFDPQENIEGGVKYLRQMIERFGDLKTALAAYNAGPAAVEQYKGIPPYKETQNYIKKILS